MKNVTAAAPHRASRLFVSEALSAARLGLLLFLLTALGGTVQAQSLKLGNAPFSSGPDNGLRPMDNISCVCQNTPEGGFRKLTLEYDGGAGEIDVQIRDASNNVILTQNDVQGGDLIENIQPGGGQITIEVDKDNDGAFDDGSASRATSCGSQPILNNPNGSPAFVIGSASFVVTSISAPNISSTDTSDPGQDITCGIANNLECVTDIQPFLDIFDPSDNPIDPNDVGTAPGQVDEVTFKFDYENTADGISAPTYPGDARNTVITVTYPQTAFSVISAPGSSSSGGGTITYETEISSGGTASFEFTLQVLGGAPTSGSVIVDASSALDDPNTSNNVCSLSFSNLPVELVAFDAVVDGRNAHLAWRTASELNNAGFEVQHRYLGATEKDLRFDALGFVDGNGTTEQPQAYSFRADGLEPGRHLFRLKQIDFDGAFEFSPEVEVMVEMPDAFVVNPVYPNPFNPEATFTFAVKQAQQVTVELYDVLGRRVTQLYQGTPATEVLQTVRIDGADLQSGIYFVQIVGERFTKTQTITLLK